MNETGTDIRRCIVTRQRAARDTLVRFAISPEGTVVPDIDERLPGRGLWLTARPDIVRKACSENCFSKAARRPVSVPADLPERVIENLDRRCLDLIALARRSGAATAGFERVREMARQQHVAALLIASDAGSAARERKFSLPPAVRMISLWTASRLGVPFGRDRVVHAAILAGRLCDRLLRETARLESLYGHGSGGGNGMEVQET